MLFLGLDGARSCAADGAAGERQQSDVASALDRHTEPALMACAYSGHAAGQNFAAFLHKLGKNVSALVVDQINLLDTELADFLFAEKLPLAAGTSTRTSGTTRAAFTASATWTAFAARAGAPDGACGAVGAGGA